MNSVLSCKNITNNIEIIANCVTINPYNNETTAVLLINNNMNEIENFQRALGGVINPNDPYLNGLVILN